MDLLVAQRLQLDRQVSHWEAAAEALRKPEDFASPTAWQALEVSIDRAVRRSLEASTSQLRREAAGLRVQLQCAHSQSELTAVTRRLQRLRRFYLQVETVVAFYAEAVNTRTSPRMAAHLRALDKIAELSMSSVLTPLGRSTPPTVTYADETLGAAILRAGVRLWDGSLSPAAAIKLARHNLYRPTSLLHETGHQVAHLLGWNEEVRRAVRRRLSADPDLADLWESWVSEITADAYAFAHCGYGAVAALHDVVANEPAMVMRLVPGDPHPVAWIRVLLGTEMCVQFYGAGPWNELAMAWKATHPLSCTSPAVASLLERSEPHLASLVDVLLNSPLTAFGGRGLSALVDPMRVSPTALTALAGAAGESLFVSPYWAHAEPIRIMALISERIALDPARTVHYTEQFEAFARLLAAPAATAAAAV
ncbi:hypothetical protein [Nocardia abscessus]|uniref:hypothetical protein n=1 Tax=Nocardia abscessus TaxID=120957 RepID=UPI0024573AC8|nr:hypothetical protein [Nocardia abscessus]